MNRMNEQLVKNTAILALGQALPKALTLIVLPLLTTHLSTAEYGLVDIANTVGRLCIPLMTLQIQQAVLRYMLAAKDRAEMTGYLASACLFWLASSCAIGPAVFFILRGAGIAPTLALSICLMLIAESAYLVAGQAVRGLGMNGRYSLGFCCYSVINLLSIVLLVAVRGMRAEGVIIASAAAYAAAALFMFRSAGIAKFAAPRFFKWECLRKLLRFSIPIIPSSLSLWVIDLSDRMLITAFLGIGANGIYAVANKLPGMYAFAYSVFNMAWTETAARAFDQGNAKDYYMGLFPALYTFLSGILALLISLTPLLFRLLVSGQFEDAYVHIPLLYLGVFFSSIVGFFGGIYVALGKTKKVGVSSFAGAVINLAVNLLLIRRLGLFAASLSTAISFLLVALYRYIDLRREIGFRAPLRTVLIGILVMAACAACCLLRAPVAIAVSLLVSCVYNYIENRPLLTGLLARWRARRR